MTWSKARFSFMKQLAVRFGKLDPTKVMDPAIPKLQNNVIGELFFFQYFFEGAEPG